MQVPWAEKCTYIWAKRLHSFGFPQIMRAASLLFHTHQSEKTKFLSWRKQDKLSMTRTQSDLRFPQFMTPQIEVLSCNRKIWVSFPLALPPQNSHPFRFPQPDAPTKNWFHSAQPYTVKTVCASFPWPHGPNNVKCVFNPTLTRLNNSLQNSISYWGHFPRPMAPKI